MSALLVLVIRFYGRLLALYPAAFRQVYAAEMQAVFAQALADAHRRGPAAALALCGRELHDLPVSIIKEHVRERVYRRKHMKLWNYSETQDLYWARMIARAASLILLAAIWISVRGHQPDSMLLLLLASHGVIIAWFQERVGGWLLVGSGATLGVTYMLGVFLGSSTFVIAPGVPPALFMLLVALIALVMSLPFITIGALFLLLDRRSPAAAPESPAV